jgi:hypothetical protein
VGEARRRKLAGTYPSPAPVPLSDPPTDAEVLEFVRRARALIATCAAEGVNPRTQLPDGQYVSLLDAETSELLDVLEGIASGRKRGLKP